MTKLDYSKATDGELLARFEQGRDQSAFAELVKRHGRMVLAIALRNLGSRQDAEDAFQATFLALARAVERLRDKGQVAAWLHGTARRTASSIRRSAKRREEHLLLVRELANEVETDATDPAEKIANEDAIKVLDEEIGRLPKKLRTAVVMCCLEGLTQDRAAKQMGISPSAVRDQLRRAKEQLRRRLMSRGVTVGVIALAAHVNSSSKATAMVNSSLVADTTSKALAYAAGNAAAEVGVNSSILHAANEVITSMTIAKITTCSLVAIALLMVSTTLNGVANQAVGGTLFFDNFQDENFQDGSPVTWEPSSFQPGFLDASSGDFVIRRNASSVQNLEVSADAVAVAGEDMSVRAVGRPLVTNSVAGVVLRTQSIDDTRGYFAGVGHSGQFGGGFVIAGVGLPNNEQSFFRTPGGMMFARIPHDVLTFDTEFQVDAFGDEIKVWAWQAGEKMPVDPLFSVTDPTYDQGHVRLVNPRPNRELSGGEVVFRSVRVADTSIVPEPSTAGLLSIGFGLLALLSRRRYP